MTTDYLDRLEKYEAGTRAIGRSWDHVQKSKSNLNAKLTCLKNFLVISNIAFVMIGGGLLGFAASLLNSGIAELAAYGLVVCTLALAGTIIFVAVLGCCGATRNSPCLLYVYVAILLSLFVLQIVLGALAFAFTSKSEEVLKAGWNSSAEDVKHETQERFECCGFDHVPEAETDPSCPPGATGACLPVIKAAVDSNLATMATMGLVTAVVEFVTLTSAICLSRGLKNTNTKNSRI